MEKNTTLIGFTTCATRSQDWGFKAYKVQYGLGFQKYYLFTAYIFTKKQAKYVLQKNEYSLVLENKYGSPKTMTKVWGILIFGLP